MNEPQASPQLLRLPGVPRVNHLLRVVPSSLTKPTTWVHDSNTMVWAMAKIILGKTAEKVGTPTEEEVRLDPAKYSEQTFLKDVPQAKLTPLTHT